MVTRLNIHAGQKTFSKVYREGRRRDLVLELRRDSTKVALPNWCSLWSSCHGWRSPVAGHSSFQEISRRRSFQMSQQVMKRCFISSSNLIFKRHRQGRRGESFHVVLERSWCPKAQRSEDISNAEERPQATFPWSPKRWVELLKKWRKNRPPSLGLKHFQRNFAVKTWFWPFENC